jgi:hypothetical protein
MTQVSELFPYQSAASVSPTTRSGGPLTRDRRRRLYVHMREATRSQAGQADGLLGTIKSGKLDL